MSYSCARRFIGTKSPGSHHPDKPPRLRCSALTFPSTGLTRCPLAEARVPHATVASKQRASKQPNRHHHHEEMWLDRLSGYSTPAPVSPVPSPAPRSRRQSHLSPPTGPQPPSFSPRSSSPSLAPNDSTTSLLTNIRRTNGSGLKQASAAADHSDPLQVLGQLLSTDGENLTSANSAGGVDSIEDLDFNGLTLREIAGEDEQRESIVKAQTVDECSYNCNIIIFISLIVSRRTRQGQI